MRLFRAQGATEYLVLLAVVLVVAIVSVALLGFFPGMASEAQVAQSQAYWQGASPIVVAESAAKHSDANNSEIYLRLRNVGMYPIRITKLLGEGQQSISYIYNGTTSRLISDFFYIAPGEELYFSRPSLFGLPDYRQVRFYLKGGTSSAHYLYAASSVCEQSGTGKVQMNDFGFEYKEYIDGQQITKKQIGKSLIIKCTG